ncbi:MAG: MarR family transcriptional regulator [Methanoregula sp.]|jgi:DNA-binding MarR family transcriptional regulator
MELRDLFLQFIGQYHEVLREVDETETGKSDLPDVTIHQFFYLQEISRNSGITLTELTQKLGVSKPSATAAVGILVRLDFVTKTRSTLDQRRYYLVLSEKGEQIIRQKQRAYDVFVERMQDRLSPENLARVIEGFELMASCFPKP